MYYIQINNMVVFVAFGAIIVKLHNSFAALHIIVIKHFFPFVG